MINESKEVQTLASITLVLSCHLCGEETEAQVAVDMPEGWVATERLYVTDCFCPEHARALEWFKAQCLHCVAGWQGWQCALGAAIGGGGFTRAQMEAIRSGVCPMRTNGSLTVRRCPGQPVEIQGVDYSKPAPPGSGDVVANAILRRRRWLRLPEYADGK